MTKVPLEVGNSCSFTKTVSESDVYQFGGITGDYSQMHFNEAFMKTTKYGTRIVHGVLTFAFGSTASTLIQQNTSLPFPVHRMDTIICALLHPCILATPLQRLIP